MLRPSILLPLLAGGALIPIACTQNFGVFESSESSAAGGSGASQSAGPTSGAGPSSGSNGGSDFTTSAVTSGISSSASSGSNSSASSSSASGSGGGGPTGEVACNDSNDNDGDAKIDCADPDCVALGYTCTDTPTGWTGPVAFHAQGTGTLPSCPSDFPQQAFLGHNNLSLPPFTCNACTCDPLAVTCAAGNAELFTDAACGGAPLLTLSQSTTCTSGTSSVQGARFLPPKVTAPAQCGAKGGGVNGQLPPPTWATNSIGCITPDKGKGCGGASTKSCSPALPAGFDKLCIFRAGNVTCPGGFPQKLSFFQSFTDSRQCTACACGTPSPSPACTAQTTAFVSADCTGTTSLDLPDNGNCFGVSGVSIGSFKLKSNTPNTPTCAASGGAATGSVVDDPATAITVCCPN